jgi:hypothetical protein
MVWALVFVLVTKSVAETWDTGMRFDNIEECRSAGVASPIKFKAARYSAWNKSGPAKFG